MVGALIMPTTVSAEGEAVVASSVTAPSVSASSNCAGVDAWSATFVVSSNAGDSGSWQLNAGAFQSTATHFVIEETHSLSESSAALSATVSFDGGAQGRPVAASVDRPEACISAPPPPAPDVEAETVSQLTDEDVVEPVAPVPTVFASSNCSGADAWSATFVISSNAADGGSWQLNDGAFQPTATDFVIEETHGMEDASASLSANVSFHGGAQGVAVAASVDRPEACISAPAPTLAPAETVPAVEVFGPVAVLAPASAATPTPDLAQTLPATGNETTILALLALASLGAGMLLVGASRRREPLNETNGV
jgi:LPXTG-motif cell wall-anchored protein